MKVKGYERGDTKVDSIEVMSGVELSSLASTFKWRVWIECRRPVEENLREYEVDAVLIIKVIASGRQCEVEFRFQVDRLLLMNLGD
jgi:hypothetical protein